ncbi:MAG: hypothetical protein JHC26_08650 [Thermofilum sp.]|uniref:hypothetical protein n=1 Tax=Thermofilum sp. TaxID=1961369 RepID=UPI0025841AD5|nr:hypothetical protein [Thermofilum sp.]MCI4408656.1 hypothetical protein [Thermofilum sp.]MCI4409146.1 hypothetical protein [Thermofilum sp.]
MARRKSRNKYWMQGAVKRPGELRKWLKRNKRRIVGAIKEDPFDEKGRIKVTALKKLRKTRFYEELPPQRKQEINYAIIAHKLRKRR